MSDGLRVVNVTKTFGGVAALTDVTFEAHAQETLALLGANGSGKTTLIGVLSGFTAANRGAVWWEGERVDRLSPLGRVQRGMSRTFQHAVVFPELTVSEHMGVVRSTGRYRRDILEWFGLDELEGVLAASLPLGLQRLLGVALAFGTNPSLVMMDEPAAGLAAPEVARLTAAIRRLRDEGSTVVVVDHDMSFVLPLADRAVVLHAGRKIFDGSIEDMRQDDHVRSSYLGVLA